MTNIKKTFLALSSILLISSSGTAHDLYTSYTSIDVQNKKLKCIFTFDITDIRKVFNLDENGDQVVSRDELLVNMNYMYVYLEQHISIIIAGESLQLAREEGSFYQDEVGNTFIHFIFQNQLEHHPWKLTLDLGIFDEFGRLHKNLAKIVHGSEIQQTIFTAGNHLQSFSFEGGDYSLTAQIMQFIGLGIEHIFLGYDHILFLMALMIIGGTFKNLIKIVTSFTVAHSITLILAALEVVILPSRLVESVIALSIVYIAIENFFVDDSDHRWLITFIFGLMHGFGFARVLTELGLPTKGLVPSLLAFNLGVEIGQIGIVAIFFPIVILVTKFKWQKRLVYGLSTIILIFGLFWFIERAFEVNFPIL